MKIDYHIHTNFSLDSKEEIEEIIKYGIENNFEEIAITDHLDLDFPDDGEVILLDIENYIKTLEKYKKKYKSQIGLKVGIELGLQPHLKDNLLVKEVLRDKRFDFIIGSIHCLNRKGLHNNEFFKDFKGTKDEAHNIYFQEIYNSISSFDGISVLGHMDFVKRYGKLYYEDYNIINYEYHKEIIIKILKHLIENNIGIEMNTSGYRYGLGEPQVGEYILREYKSLGGKILTIGSDAHQVKDLGAGFTQGKKLLKDIGFTEVTTFSKKNPHNIKL